MSFVGYVLKPIPERDFSLKIPIETWPMKNKYYYAIWNSNLKKKKIASNQKRFAIVFVTKNQAICSIFDVSRGYDFFPAKIRT